MKPIAAPFIIAGALLLGPLPAMAQSGAQSGDASGASQTRETVMDRVFSAAERRIIGEHFGKSPDSMTDEDATPPDWAARGAEADDDDDGEKDDDERASDRGKPDKDKGKGKGNGNGKGKSKQMPPGLAKRDTLPPGLARQYEKNGKLPPGLAKRDLPADLSAKLPKRPDDQEVTIVEDDVVLTDKATGVILDVIKDVVTGGGGDASANPDGTLADPDEDAAAEDTILDTVLKGIFGGRGTQ